MYTGFILSGKHGKVKEFKVIWKSQGNKQKKAVTFFWKITNFNTNIKKVRSRIFNWYCVLSVAQHF
jgi:hypothetical protein